MQFQSIKPSTTSFESNSNVLVDVARTDLSVKCDAEQEFNPGASQQKRENEFTDIERM